MALSRKTWMNSFCNMYKIVLNVLFSRGGATTQRLLYIFIHATAQRRGVWFLFLVLIAMITLI